VQRRAQQFYSGGKYFTAPLAVSAYKLLGEGAADQEVLSTLRIDKRMLEYIREQRPAVDELVSEIAQIDRLHCRYRKRA
jgi:hypothetical protein